MNNLIDLRPSILLILLALLGSCRQNAEEPQSSENTPPVVHYDSLRASRLGADDYGMRTYVVAFLKQGPNRDLPQEEASALQMGHLKNIERMAREGTLSLAGPFLDSGVLRGIYIFNVTTLEEAEALTATDPAIAAGLLTMELRPWYGSAAIQEVDSLHQTLARKAITD